MGGVCPLFFDGATCTFNELPLPNNSEAIRRVYDYINKINRNSLFFIATKNYVNLIAETPIKKYLCNKYKHFIVTIKNLFK